MDDQRVGRIVRALRQRRGWRQVDVARAAGCSQNMVSLVERGHLDRASLRLVRRLLASVDASVGLEVRWRGAALDRLLDEGHANLVSTVAEHLRELGWLVEVEVTYSEFGERGSFDVLAFRPQDGVVLVVEVKTDLPSAEATLRKLDAKARLAPKIARERFGSRSRAVARLLVLPDSSTLRRRTGRHAALFERALPVRNVEIRAWLRRPGPAISGLWFLSPSDGRVVNPTTGRHERVRRPKSAPGNHVVAA